MTGWIKLHRKITECQYWLDEPFTRGQAWVDMLILASYEPGFIRVQGMRVDVSRGQLAWSEVNLASRWRWSRGKVRRFFAELEIDKMIVRETHENQDKRKSVITILNYDKYQTGIAENDQATEQASIQASIQAAGQDKEVKEVKEEKKLPCAKNAQGDEQKAGVNNFDLFWKAYPKKRSKGEAVKAWKQVKGDSILDVILKSVESFKSLDPQWSKDGGQFVPYPASWLRAHGWEDEIETGIKAVAVIRCHECDNERNPNCINRTDEQRLKCTYFKEAVAA